MSNNIFSGSMMQTSQQLSSHANGSYFKKDRVNLLTSQIAGDFNTYRNWKEFELEVPFFAKPAGGSDDPAVKYVTKLKLLKSLFSNTSAVYSASGSMRDDLNIPLLDTPSKRQSIRDKTNCTIKTLVEESAAGNLGRAIYNYSDFMYCKHLGKVPNNHLITLRKFPSGCGDHINFTNVTREKDTNKHMPDIGRLVTWIGADGNNMENILKYSYKLPWQTNKAPVNESPFSQKGNMKALGKVMALLNTDYASNVQKGIQASQLNPMGGSVTESVYDPNTELSNNNRIMGDMQNTIQEVIVPGGKDGGMTFDQNITLVFNYELRSYDGINPKSAFLDLIGNILMVTYMQGKFFGGSYRSFETYNTNAYANLDIFKQSASGDIRTPADLLNATWNTMTGIKDAIMGDSDSVTDALKKISGNLFQVYVGNLVTSLGRPEKLGMTSMISPAPTGQWHLTIGNPRNPIMSIGNLILENATVEHYGPLGLDDFPSGIKVTVELKHAKARDSVAIEQMYMQGNSRIYTPANKEVLTMYNEATEYKSFTDTTSISTSYETFNTSSETGADRADVSSTANATDTYSQSSSTSSNIYNKLFGTTDTNMITIASQEAMVGAYVAKTTT